MFGLSGLAELARGAVRLPVLCGRGALEGGWQVAVCQLPALGFGHGRDAVRQDAHAVDGMVRGGLADDDIEE